MKESLNVEPKQNHDRKRSKEEREKSRQLQIAEAV